MVERESSGGKTTAVTITDAAGDSIRAELADGDVLITASNRDGDYQQVGGLSRAHAQQFAAMLADLAGA